MSRITTLNWPPSSDSVVVTLDSQQSAEDYINNLPVTPSNYTIIAKGGKFTLVLLGLTVSPEAQDVLARLTGLTGTENAALIKFVDAEVANGNWGTKGATYTDSKYDAVYPLGLVTLSNAIQQIHPSNAANLSTNEGAVKVADGLSIGSTSQFLDTGFLPPTMGNNYTLNDCQAGVYVKTNSSSGAERIISFEATANESKVLADGRIQLNGGAPLITPPSGGVLTADSLYTFNRRSSTLLGAFKNGVDQGTGSATSAALSEGPMFLGRPTSGLIGVMSFLCFSRFTTFDQTGFNTNVTTLLTDLGILP